MEKDYTAAWETMQRIIAAKEESRQRDALLPWHEKVAIAQRLRDAGRIARASMREHLARSEAKKTKGNA